MRKQNFIKGSVILMVSAAAAKLLGAIFKIPLTNLLGGVGMSYFSCAYSIFLPIYALVVTGLSSATARLTAQSAALEMYDNARLVRKTALKLFSLLGLVGTLFTALLAKPFCEYAAKTPDAVSAVVLISPAVFFGCITAVERGYHEGMSDMYPTAFSQLAEGIVKAAAGLAICMLTIENSEAVLRFFPKGIDSRAVAAAGAIFGVTLSSVAAAAYFPITRVFGKRVREACAGDTTLISKRSIIKDLLKIAVPIGISSVVTNLTALIDMGTLIGGISRYKGAEALFSGADANQMPQFVYGSFSAIALTVFNLVPSVTNMLGKGILPAVTSAWECNDVLGLKKSTGQALTAAGLMAVPSAVGIGVLSSEILYFLFPHQTDEVRICVNALRYLMPGMLFLCLSFPVFSMLQAIGKAAVPLKIMVLGAVLKLIGNLLLIPLMGVDGSALSTTICYAVILILSLAVYMRTTRITLDKKPFVSIIYSGVICGVSAGLVRDISEDAMPSVMVLGLSVIAGAAGYVAALWLSGVVKINGR